MEPEILWSAGQRSNHLAKPARAKSYPFIFIFIICLHILTGSLAPTGAQLPESNREEAKVGPSRLGLCQVEGREGKFAVRSVGLKALHCVFSQLRV